jgi:hypothetical protein
MGHDVCRERDSGLMDAGSFGRVGIEEGKRAWMGR